MDFFNFLKNNKFIILSISIIANILLIGLSGYLFYKNVNKEERDNLALATNYESEKDNNLLDEFYVEIKGAIKNPGVYKLKSDNIINDLINVAGGFTKNAYTKNINLSRKVTNELVVYVYTESEYKKLHQENIVYVTKEVYIDTPCECSTYDISSCIENSKSEIISSDKDTVFESVSDNASSVSTKENNSKVNINTATSSELQTLSGIGASKAKDIINYRNTNGNFKSIAEIKNVNGIGNALFEKIKDCITV